MSFSPQPTNDAFPWIKYLPWKTLECHRCHTRHVTTDGNIREMEYKRFVLVHQFCKGYGVKKL